MTRSRAPNAPSPMYLTRTHRRRCGGGFQRGRDLLVAPLWLSSLVTFLFSDKKVTYIVHAKKYESIRFLKLQKSTLRLSLRVLSVFLT